MKRLLVVLPAVMGFLALFCGASAVLAETTPSPTSSSVPRDVPSPSPRASSPAAMPSAPSALSSASTQTPEPVFQAAETNNQTLQTAEFGSQESLTRIRDPFQKPTLTVTAGVPKSELERYPVEQFELLGVITGAAHMRAMVRAPDKKTHVISENVKMGTRNGAVKKITSGSITVREKVLNVFGQEEEVDTELKLLSKGTGS